MGSTDLTGGAGMAPLPGRRNCSIRKRTGLRIAVDNGTMGNDLPVEAKRFRPRLSPVVGQIGNPNRRPELTQVQGQELAIIAGEEAAVGQGERGADRAGQDFRPGQFDIALGIGGELN